MKKSILFILMWTFCLPLLSQSKREYLQYGDEAFKSEAYSTAAFFYLKVLDPNSGLSEKATFPQELKFYEPPPKEKKTDSSKTSEAVKDSLLPKLQDSVTVKKDTAQKKMEPGNIIADIRMQYVVHQLAECYRLSHNYEK